MDLIFSIPPSHPGPLRVLAEVKHAKTNVSLVSLTRSRGSKSAYMQMDLSDTPDNSWAEPSSAGRCRPIAESVGLADLLPLR